MARSRYGSFLFLAALAALISGGVRAQVAVFPVGVEPIGFNSANSLMSTATYEARLAASSSSVANNALYYRRAVAFSEATVANGARSRFALGPAVALSAAMLAAGYAIDSLVGQITAPATPSALGDFASMWCAGNYPSCSGIYGGKTDPEAAAVWWATYQGRWGGLYCSKFLYTWNNGAPGWYSVKGRKADGVTTCSLADFSVYYALKTGGADPTSDPKLSPQPSGPASDKQVVQVIKANPITWPEITHRPLVGNDGTPAPADNIGKPRVLTPMPQQMQEVQAQYRTDQAHPLAPGEVEGPVPAAEDTSTATPAPGAGTTVQPAPATPPSATVSFPVFCTWASKVCDFVDWMNAPDVDAPPDAMPEKQITAATWESGLGGGSCPAPATVIVAGVSQTATYQPLCDLATGIKPFLLIVAALGAALILARG